MARTIYSRRHTELSWVGAGERKSKDVLRYRISPVDKKLDALDVLERELEKQIDKVDSETYDEYSRILEVKRERLEVARRKERGEPPEPSLEVRIKLTPRAAKGRHKRRVSGITGALIFVILFIIFIVFSA